MARPEIDLPLARSAITVPLFFLLAWLSAVALQNLRADALLRDANEEVEAWAAAGLRPANETWSATYQQLQRSTQLAGNNPATSELMAHMASQRTDSTEYAREAIVHLARALELRPSSPYSWAALAEGKYRHGDTKGLFEIAIRHAVALGPAEPGVQRLVANYGLAVWDEISESTRKSVDQMVRAGVRRLPAEMLQIAGRRGRLQAACRHLEHAPRMPDSKWLRLCQSTEATP